VKSHRWLANAADLADPLEGAGCAIAEILNHRRRPATIFEHCWPIHLLLGKE